MGITKICFSCISAPNSLRIFIFVANHTFSGSEKWMVLKWKLSGGMPSWNSRWLPSKPVFPVIHQVHINFLLVI